MAFRTLLDGGIHAAAGSDFSPGRFDPRMAIQGMVTRTSWDGKTWGSNQKISVDEAIRVNTLNGAYNSHEEDIKGSITAGKLADYVVLADDPHSIPVARLRMSKSSGPSSAVRRSMKDRSIPADAEPSQPLIHALRSAGS